MVNIQFNQKLKRHGFYVRTCRFGNHKNEIRIIGNRSASVNKQNTRSSHPAYLLLQLMDLVATLTFE